MCPCKSPNCRELLNTWKQHSQSHQLWECAHRLKWQMFKTKRQQKITDPELELWEKSGKFGEFLCCALKETSSLSPFVGWVGEITLKILFFSYLLHLS